MIHYDMILGLGGEYLPVRIPGKAKSHYFGEFGQSLNEIISVSCYLTLEICLRQNPLTSWVMLARFDTIDRSLQLPL